MEKYQNTYRNSSLRADWWNYGNAASYFITVCTANRQHFFGHIKGDIMCLNEIGTLLHQEWERTSDLRPDMNLKLGPFVVMPDHFHGIITIGENKYNQVREICTDRSSTKNQFGPQRKNLSAIIRGLKSSVTKQARIINPEFAWQS